MEQAIGAMLAMFGLFGGLSLLVWVVAKTLPEMQRLGLLKPRPPKPVRTWQIRMPFLDMRQVHVNPVYEAPPNEAILQEMQALRRQMQEMQSTCHQFDISFDAALNRLEERVSRVEVKAAGFSTAYPKEEQRIRLS
jgi:hypothetical protein